jgi:hypothetical protein
MISVWMVRRKAGVEIEEIEADGRLRLNGKLELNQRRVVVPMVK